jgi:hypothetical protein
MKLKRQWKLGLIGLVLGMVVAALWTPMRVLIDLWSLIPPARVMVKYNANNEANLKALRLALMAYHESEGEFPDASGWMDAIKSRVKVDNMSSAESDKKFVNPLYPAKTGVFGYALNDAASRKYKGDLKKNTILIFDSTDTAWNAHGDPVKLRPAKPFPGGQVGITVEGSIVRL